MTTREQIRQVSQESENELCSNYQSFVLGAEYGYNLAIEKVCECIDSIDFEQRYLDGESLFDKESFINDLKQAMKL